MPTIKSLTLTLAAALALTSGAALANSPQLTESALLDATVSAQQSLINRPDVCSQLELSAGLRGEQCGVMSTAELVAYYLDEVS